MDIKNSNSLKILLSSYLDVDMEEINSIIPLINNAKDNIAMKSVLVDLICTAVLPTEYKGVKFPGHDMTLLFIDTDHKLKIEEISDHLQTTVRKVAEVHFRGLDRAVRATQRLTSKDQWQIVKKSLERILLLEVFSSDTLEICVSGLRRLVSCNSNISLVFINSINTFFRQVFHSTGMYSGSYLRKLLMYLVQSCTETNQGQQLSCLYTQHNLFNSEDTFYQQIRSTDMLGVLKDPIFLDIGEKENSFVLAYKQNKSSKSYKS